MLKDEADFSGEQNGVKFKGILVIKLLRLNIFQILILLWEKLPY